MGNREGSFTLAAQRLICDSDWIDTLGLIDFHDDPIQAVLMVDVWLFVPEYTVVLRLRILVPVPRQTDSIRHSSRLLWSRADLDNSVG
ncbi:hypothetical protein D3C76_1284860 [compost metagenome]